MQRLLRDRYLRYLQNRIHRLELQLTAAQSRPKTHPRPLHTFPQAPAYLARDLARLPNPRTRRTPPPSRPQQPLNLTVRNPSAQKQAARLSFIPDKVDYRHYKHLDFVVNLPKASPFGRQLPTCWNNGPILGYSYICTASTGRHRLSEAGPDLISVVCGGVAFGVC
jgi:hypothetical protein